jgi:hypothetical protein
MVMRWRNVNASTLRSTAPKQTWCDELRARFTRGAELDSQSQSQAKDGIAAVVNLSTTFAGLGGQASRPMSDYDRRLHLVAMLSTWTTAAIRSDVTLSDQLFDF